MKINLLAFLVGIIVLPFFSFAQPANDLCANAQLITIPASGNTCFNSTNVGATSNLVFSTCDGPTPSNEVWFTYIATGGSNSITVTPNGATPASGVVIDMMTGNCGGTVLSTCNSGAGAAAVTATFAYAIGTQIFFSVETNGADGTFQVCVNSISQPPAPGNSCPTATTICSKSNFSLPLFPLNVNIITPSCFPSPFQQPLFYKFTCGQSGTCIWTIDPIGNAEYDWVMYDITAGCPGTNVCCNFNYGNGNGSPIGMATGGAGACGTAGFAGAPGEFSPPANLTIGNTYLIVIDNYSNNTVGFNMSWGGTFEIAPNPEFTVTPNSGCAPLNVTINNISTASTSYSWNFNNGNTSVATNPPAQTYSTPGNYLISLTATSATGCINAASQSITVNPNPIVTPETNTTVCAGANIPLNTLASNVAGATFAWTNSNTAIGLAASGSGNIPAFTGTNSTSAPITATITVTATISGCTSPPITFTITINPSPVLMAETNQTFCNGVAVPLNTLVSTPTGATFAWTNSQTSIGLAASGTGNIPAFTATNSSAAAVVSTISITPTIGLCSGPVSTFTITVNPLPVANPVANITSCSGVAVPATVNSSSPVGATFAWTNSNTTIGLAASGSGNIPSFTALNGTAAPISSTVTITPSIGVCTGSPINYTITITALPTLPAMANISQCGGTVVVPAFVSNPAGATINWTNSNSAIGLGTTGTGSIASFTGTNSSAAPISGNIVVTPSIGSCIGSAVTFQITINPTPIIANVADITNCPGVNNPSLTVAITPAATPFSWVNSNTATGLGASGATNPPSFVGVNASSASITSTITINATAFGCAAVPEIFTITITPQPTMNAIVSNNFCANTTVPAIAFSSAVPGVTYAWTNSQSSIGLPTSGSGNIGSFTGINNTIALVTGNFVVTPSLGACVGVPQIFTIGIKPVPVPTAGNNGPICAGSTANLTSTSLVGSTFSWSGPNAFTSLIQNPSLVAATVAQAGNYTVTATLNGCSGNASTNLVINPSINATITSVSPQCSNANDFVLVANPIGGTWSGSGITNVASGLFSPANATIGNNIVTYTLGGACSSPVNATIVVNPLPVVNFSSPDLTGCVPFTTSFVDNSVPASSNVVWDFGDGSTSSSLGGVSHTYNASGCYTISLTSTTNGCSATSTIPNYICANPFATASFDVSEDVITLTQAQSSMINQSTGANTYLWEFGDNSSTSSLENPSHIFDMEPGLCVITLIANNAFNCPDTATRAIVMQDELIYYVPNSFTPDGDAYNNTFKPIMTSGISFRSYHLTIYNRWGEVIFESLNSDIGWDGTYLGKLCEPGTYVWKIEFKNTMNDKHHEKLGHVTILK